jgi:hypothetical protein
MSEINDLYLEISIHKDEALTQARQAAEVGRAEQLLCEEWIHNCQLRADGNLAKDVTGLSDKDLQLIPLEDYPDDQKPSPSDMERWTPEELLQFRMEHDLAELPNLKQRLEDILARRDELKERLATVRHRYGAILPKVQRMYDELMGLLRK